MQLNFRVKVISGKRTELTVESYCESVNTKQLVIKETGKITDSDKINDKIVKLIYNFLLEMRCLNKNIKSFRWNICS